jgi:serpin B
VNAVSLDATWASQFDLESAFDGSFVLIDGAEIEVPLMQSAAFPYAAGDGWQALELPYLRHELGMTLIVPDEGRFSEVEGSLSRGLVADVSAGRTPVEVALTMPKSESRTQAGLNPALRELGMGGFRPEIRGLLEDDERRATVHQQRDP